VREKQQVHEKETDISTSHRPTIEMLSTEMTPSLHARTLRVRTYQPTDNLRSRESREHSTAGFSIISKQLCLESIVDIMHRCTLICACNVR
jgi:hypothetical protein